MYNRHSSQSNQLMRQAEELIRASSNRYRVTVQVANRAKRRRQEDFDSMDEPTMKPVIQAVIEMWEELNQPEILAD